MTDPADHSDDDERAKPAATASAGGSSASPQGASIPAGEAVAPAKRSASSAEGSPTSADGSSALPLDYAGPIRFSTTTAQPAPAPDQPVPDEYDVLCESCGYSLVGLMTDRCPECGAAFDPSALPLARVPWLYRKRLGRWRAYWRTVAMVLRDPDGFAAELRRPVRVSADDAAAFRRLSVRLVPASVLLAAVPAVATWALVAGPAQVMAAGATEVILAILTVAAVAVFLVAVPLWLWTALGTDMPTFIWSGLEDNPDDLAPVHHYAAAPLALAVVLVPLAGMAGAGSMLLLAGPGVPPPVAALPGLILLLPIVALLWWVPVRLMRSASTAPPRRVIGLALYLPVHWFLICAMSCMLVPAVVSVFVQGAVYVLRNI